MSNDLRDFLAWFEGFRENIKARPTASQWAKVVERIKTIQIPSPAAAPPRVVGNLSSQGGNNESPKPKPAMSSGSAMSAGP